MSTDPIRIILVDDHKLARESISLLLGLDKRYSVIKSCDNGQDGIDQAQLLCPDVMLVDINMEPVSGFEVVKKVIATNPDIKIIGISINNSPVYVNRMLTFGARGFVTKGSPLEEVKLAIEEVLLGKEYLSEDVRGFRF